MALHNITWQFLWLPLTIAKSLLEYSYFQANGRCIALICLANPGSQNPFSQQAGLSPGRLLQLYWETCGPSSINFISLSLFCLGNVDRLDKNGCFSSSQQTVDCAKGGACWARPLAPVVTEPPWSGIRWHIFMAPTQHYCILP